MNRDEQSWHLDKKVPIALVVGMVLQFGVAMMYVARLEHQTSDNTRRIALLEAQRVNERLASVEAQLQDAKALLLRIDDRLDRLQKQRGGQ